MPERIRQSRAKGARIGPNASSVARSSKMGNPFVVGDVVQVEYQGLYFEFDLTPVMAVEAFRQLMETRLSTWPNMAAEDRAYSMEWADRLEKLRGRDLACYCPLGQPCHADVVLDLANRGPAGYWRSIVGDDTVQL